MIQRISPEPMHPDFGLEGLLQAVVTQPDLAQLDLPLALRTELVQQLLANPLECAAFGVTTAIAETTVDARSRLLQQVYPQFQQWCGDRSFEKPLVSLWRLWLPLAMQLATAQDKFDRPLIQGILGGQGTGKTTLAAILKLILKTLGKQVCCLSLDDLYKPYEERQQLQRTDPRLRWRGPPGTHDVALGLRVLQQLRQAKSSEWVEIPRFDKSAWGGAGDRTTPEIVQTVDVVLFEGWFVGVRPIEPAVLKSAPPPIVTEGDRQFAYDCNARLYEYLPLWHQLDRLMVLYPADYRLSQQWRREAEQQMAASGPGMSDAEINKFVEYFWRSLHPELFIKPLLHNSAIVDLVVEINSNHTIGSIRGKGRQ